MTADLDRAAAAALARREDVARVLGALDGGGEETRIVGGAIRNALIGRPVQDVDLATTAAPGETSRRAVAAGFRAVPTGIEHGTVTVIALGTAFEVTTLREDVETDGRHARVRFGRDFAADARRRDFTVNALSLGPDGAIHDHVGGLADLAARRIRFIGDAARRIAEDYLRVLRFFRFHAEYGLGEPDRAGLAAAIAARSHLARLSRERVRTELLKLLAAPRGAEIAAIFEQAGLLGRVVSAVGDAGRLRRSAALPPILRLGAYLVRSTADAARLREELRLSKAEESRLAAHAGALAQLVSVGAVGTADIRRAAVLHGAEAVAAVLAVTAGEPRPCVAAAAADLAGRFASGETPPPQFPLRGADLVRDGVAAGPEIGRRLAEARRAWLDAGCPDGETLG